MPYYSGPANPRGGVAVLTVTRKIRYELKSDTADQTVIRKKLGLDSRIQSGTEPRVSASGEGEFVFDRQSGFIRSSTMQFKDVLNGENITRRPAGSVRVTRLEGEERETALRASADRQTDRPARKLTSDEVQKIMDDLKSNDPAARMAAASKLQTSELTEAPAALLELMTGLLPDTDMSVRMAAAKVIADYGTAEQVPALLKLLRSSDTSARWAAIRGLGRLRDKRAAEPLAALLASGGSDGYQAVEALTKIGPDAEDAIIPLLKEKHIDTRRQACTVLKQIGTQKSMEPLRALLLDPDPMVNSAAAEAIREISTRQ
jgi:HEAT repeat protein